MAEELWHHGIKGQKWGVRRTPEQLGHATSGNSDKSSSSANSSNDQAKTSHRGNGKTGKSRENVDDMSNAELKERVQRMQLTKQYKDLKGQERLRYVKAAIAVLATTTVITSNVITLNRNVNTIKGLIENAISNFDIDSNVVTDTLRASVK